jgi:hypothetical protein
MSGVLRFCLFWAFLGKGSSKAPCKYFGKKSWSKTFYKTIDKKSKNRGFFPSNLFSKKMTRKTNKSDPGPFLGSDPPTHPPTGVTGVFFAGGPWPLGSWQLAAIMPYLYSGGEHPLIDS